MKLLQPTIPEQEHAKISPSGSKRWMACPGSFQMTKDIVQAEAGHPARWGTVGHWIGEQCLVKDKEAKEYLGMKVKQKDFPEMTISDITVDQELISCVQEYLDVINDIRMKHAGQHQMYVEVKVMADDSTDMPVYGTVDCLIITRHIIYVIDLKTGSGVSVDADSPQLLIYAWGAIQSIPKKYLKDIKEVQTIISQPRDKRGQTHKVNKTTLKKLKKWVKTKLKPAITDVMKPAPPLNPGEDQCRWCAARTTCSALADFVMSDTLRDFNTLTLPEMVENYKKFALMKSWIKDVTGHIHGLLHEGKKVPGLKLVKGRNSKQWNIVEKKLAKILKSKGITQDQMYPPPSMMSPAGALKLLTAAEKRELSKYISLVEGNPSIASEDDKRDPYIIDIASDFEDKPEE